MRSTWKAGTHHSYGQDGIEDAEVLHAWDRPAQSTINDTGVSSLKAMYCVNLQVSLGQGSSCAVGNTR